MVHNLKQQECVNGVRSLSVRRRDAHLRALFRFFIPVVNLVAEMRHCRHARRRRAVREHRRLEIARGKHGGDVRQVLANLFAAFRVFGIIYLDFDGSPVLEEPKVVRSLGVREAHGLVAVLHHLVLMIAAILWRVLLLPLAR